MEITQSDMTTIILLMSKFRDIDSGLGGGRGFLAAIRTGIPVLVDQNRKRNCCFGKAT